LRACDSKRFCCSVVLLVVTGCVQTAPAPAPGVVAATATPVIAPTPTATRVLVRATDTPRPASLKTFHAQIAFETYETEETVQLELGQLPGVASVNVTQLDVTVQYDPARLSEDEIMRTLRNNPEVRIKDDTRAGQ
jgi:hypothetical protein